LPPEFSRAERWDGVFFLDLPAEAEKTLIWRQYRSQFQIPDSQHRPDDSSWTGAEIKACCRLAALLEVPLTQAAQHVVPVAVTASEAVDKLRGWASGRCLSASAPGIFRKEGEPAPKLSRRVQRPSNN
jgi:SpoVK/Ycf46/Vps4 family AAA+-type ATPase